MTLETLIPKLSAHRVLVVGDVILDEYVYGSVERVSREAPVPVLELRERRYIPGGAANPASNITALGSEAVQIGITGNDEAAQHLRSELTAHGIDTSALFACEGRPTTLKTRIMAQMGLRFPQQVARIDTLSRAPVDAATEQRIIQHIKQEIEGGTANAVLFSDYHTGLLTPAIVENTRQMAQQANLIVTADAQGKLEKYAGVRVVKCNADDAQDYLVRPLVSDLDYGNAALELVHKLRVTGAMVITRGAAGATVATAQGKVTHCPAPKVSDVFDTVGAGDTSIAVMTLALCGGASYEDAVHLANYASGIVVRHVGNYTPTPDELLQAVKQGAKASE